MFRDFQMFHVLSGSIESLHSPWERSASLLACSVVCLVLSQTVFPTRTAGKQALRSQGLSSAQWRSDCLFQLPERELVIGAGLIECGQRGVVRALRIEQF